MSSKKEREFQISLAELSADVQIYLSAGLGVAGISIAYFIGLEQIYFSLPSKTDVVALAVLFSLVVGTVIGILYLRFFLIKAEEARKKISDLREKYTKQEGRG